MATKMDLKLQQANDNCATSQYWLAEYYEQKSNNPTNSKIKMQLEKQAFVWLLKAANNNHQIAQFELARFYTYSIGCECNYSVIWYWINKAATGHKVHHEPSLIVLSFLLARGIGCAANLQEALRFAQLAASNGNPEALNRLGNIYDKLGRIDKAIDIFRQVLQIRPTLQATYSNLSLILAQVGRDDKAFAMCRRGLEITPDPASKEVKMIRKLRDQDENFIVSTLKTNLARFSTSSPQNVAAALEYFTGDDDQIDYLMTISPEARMIVRQGYFEYKKFRLSCFKRNLENHVIDCLSSMIIKFLV